MEKKMSEKIGRKVIFDHLMKDHPYKYDPMTWHIFKFKIWPSYSQMLNTLIESRMADMVYSPHEESEEMYEKREAIVKASGMEWGKICGLYGVSPIKKEDFSANN